jgi:hypothetical protein
MAPSFCQRLLPIVPAILARVDAAVVNTASRIALHSALQIALHSALHIALHIASVLPGPRHLFLRQTKALFGGVAEGR